MRAELLPKSAAPLTTFSATSGMLALVRVAASYQKMLSTVGLALALAFPCLLSAAPVDANPPNLATGVTQLSDALRELASKVRAEDLAVALPALQQLHLTVQNFKVRNISELSKPFQKVGNNTRTGYHQLAALVDRMEMQTNDAESWRRMGRDVESVRSLLITGTSEPTVHSYSPIAVSPGEGAVNMVVRGQKLDKGDATVEVGGIALVPRTNDTGDLTFSAPGTIFKGEDGSIGTAEVLVNSSRTKRPLLIPGVFAGQKLTGFELLVFVLPKRAATYLVTAKAPGVGNERREVRSDPVSAVSQDSITTSQSCEPVRPAEGWRVDTSIPPQWTQTDSQNGSFDGVQQLTEEGFCLQFTLRGQGVARGRGTISGYVTYNEFKASAGSSGGEIARGDLTWNDRAIVPLPANTESFEVQIVFYDGSQSIHTEVGRSGTVRIDRDLSSNGLSVSVVTPGI